MASLARIAALLTAVAASTSASGAEEAVDYLRDVKPILQQRCYSCHGALKQESSLRLDTGAAARTGGDSGPAIAAGDAAGSLLIERVADDAARMPPEGEPLSERQIATIARWIDAGAPAPSDEQPQPDPRDHWAFRPPLMSPVSPQDPPGAGLVDRLVSRVHRRQGLSPAPPADRGLLLRRVSLDLTGLPPTAEQTRRFVEDRSADAYRQAVERLLESPQYGQRWARHWMDVWRYADWSGEKNNQVRGSPKHIWRWRDWIVESLNGDKGYDRMVLEMLAGDELAPGDADTLRATGYLARNWYKFNRNVWLDDTVEHTGKAFLGLTFNCAKCHDHKYDPVSQRNYYQLRAFFEPHDVRTDPVPGADDTEKDGLVRVYDAHPDTATYVFHRGDQAQPETSRPLTARLPEVLGGQLRIEPVELPLQHAAGEGGEDDMPRTSTGRRLALARWIVDRGNPLAARVAVNHVWLRHFGAPLADGLTDFGLRSPRPPLAELLDSLAVDLMEHRWSLKHLHRRIVLSDLYQMQSGFVSTDNQAADPDNRLLWRMNHRRMEGEVIRDSVLLLSGQLDLSQGGPEIPLDEAETSVRRSIYFRHGHERQAPLLQTFDGASVLECYRRNMTIVPQQALALSNSVLVRRQSRIIAAGIAAQLKGDAAARTDSAGGTNDGGGNHGGGNHGGGNVVDDRRFVETAFVHLLGRPPRREEADRCVQFLQSQLELLAGKLSYDASSPQAGRAADNDPRQRARASLVHVLLNHNDFVTIR